jgi:hypothetical protein
MDMIVWVDGWQMQCCGEPFRLGTRVTWTLSADDSAWIKEMLGADTPRMIDAAEEHHGGIPENTAPTQGTVTRIEAVHFRYESRPGSDPRNHYPVPGSGTLTDLDSADGWTADRGGEQFSGYIVQLKL